MEDFNSRRPVKHGGVRLRRVVHKSPISSKPSAPGGRVPASHTPCPPPPLAPSSRARDRGYKGRLHPGSSPTGETSRRCRLVLSALLELAAIAFPLTLQASDQPVVTASHQVQFATSSNTSSHTRNIRIRQRLALASLTTMEWKRRTSVRMVAAASQKTTGRRSAAATSSTTSHSPPWWRAVTRSTSTYRIQPVTG